MPSECESLSGVASARVWEYRSDIDDDVLDAKLELPESAAQVRQPLLDDSDALLNYLAYLEDDEPSGKFAFVETSWFQGMVAMVIFMNCMLIGVETNLGSDEFRSFEDAFLAFFCIEMFARIANYGYAFVNRDVILGNLLDLFIVVVGVVDLWFLPFFRVLAMQREDVEQRDVDFILEMLRLLRIFRLMRLVKLVPQLHRLAAGIFEAVHGMVWVLVFLSIMLYAFAIICTRLIGQGQLTGDAEDNDEDVAKIQEFFGSIPSSMFILFEMMSCWSLMRFTPMFLVAPYLKVLAVLFYIITAWALLAVMTGVVSEKMLAVRDALNLEERVNQRMSGLSTLVELFTKADADKSGSISRDEFDAMLGAPEVVKTLMGNVAVNVHDFRETFERLAGETQECDIQAFATGYQKLHEDMTPQLFFKFKEDIIAIIRGVRRRAGALVDERFEELLCAVRQPLRRILAITEQIQRLEHVLTGPSWARLLHKSRTRVTQEELEEFERRMSARIDTLDEAVKRLEELQKQELVVLEEQESTYLSEAAPEEE